MSHREASTGLIFWFSPLVDELDATFDKRAKQEVKGVLDEPLNPDTILFLLLLVVLARINRFFPFLQKTLTLANPANNSNRIYEYLKKAWNSFRLKQITFIEKNDEINKKIVNFHQNFKKKYSMLQLILILKRQFFFYYIQQHFMVILNTANLMMTSKYESRSLPIIDEAQISDDIESSF